MSPFCYNCMVKNKALIVSFLVLMVVITAAISLKNQAPVKNNPEVRTRLHKSTEESPTNIPVNSALPEKYTMQGGSHSFQTFNNCGPAALSMALSFYGIVETQEKLGQDLRPYQVKSGDNDDKSVTLEELAQKADSIGFIAFYRPGGNIELLKKFIVNDMPVITTTLTKKNEDIGHYRVIYGYDDRKRELTQNDSLQGRELTYTYLDFMALWKQFGYQYLVLVPQEKLETAKEILGEYIDEQVAWEKTAAGLTHALTITPEDTTTRFLLSIAYFNIGKYQDAVNEFEKVESLLPKRALWYQIEPIKAYYQLGNYDRVLSITSNIIENGNRAFSELYIIRGNVFLNQGNVTSAKAEYEKAVYYNENLKEAKERLNLIAI